MVTGPVLLVAPWPHNNAIDDDRAPASFGTPTTDVDPEAHGAAQARLPGGRADPASG
jgi:hypothetical protein